MANLITGTFTHWNLSSTEKLQGSILSIQQKQVLQNELAQVAEQIVNLEFDPNNPVSFAQNDAHLKGQMSIIRYMLLRSDESEQQLKSQADPSEF